MKIKFFAIYVLAGAAFLGVSLWVFLSKGKNARALRAKYKLGGMMLTAWTMFSSAACEGVTPQVTCYEPVEPEILCYDVPMETDVFRVSVKGKDGYEITAGETLLVTIETPTFKEYECRIHAGKTSEDSVIQKAVLTIAEEASEDGKVEFEIKLNASDYKGIAAVTLWRIYLDEDGKRQESILPYTHEVTIR